MSIIVKGMEMPDSCAVCRFAGRGGYFMERIVCMFTGENEDAENVDRLSDCPLIALPDHHGRLVDADATIKEIKARNPDDVSYEDAWAITCIEHAPTIVKAEDRE